MGRRRSGLILMLGLLLIAIAVVGWLIGPVAVASMAIAKETFSPDNRQLATTFRADCERLMKRVDAAPRVSSRRRVIDEIRWRCQVEVIGRIDLAHYSTLPLWRVVSGLWLVRFVLWPLLISAGVGICLHRSWGRRLAVMTALVLLAAAAIEGATVVRYLADIVDGFVRDYRIAYQTVRAELEDSREILAYFDDMSIQSRVPALGAARVWFALHAVMPLLIVVLVGIPAVGRRLDGRSTASTSRVVPLASFLVVPALFFLSACATNADDPLPTALEIEGEARLREGDVTTSREILERAIITAPDSYYARVGLALCAAKTGDQVAFEDHSLRAGALAPQTPNAWERLGVMYIQGAERFRRSPAGVRYAQLGIGLMRQVFAAEPERPQVVYHLGLGLFLAEDPFAAEIFLEEARRRAPERLDVVHVLLLTYRRLERRDRVLAVIAHFDDLGADTSAWQSLRTWAEAGAKRPVGSVGEATSRPTNPKGS